MIALSFVVLQNKSSNIWLLGHYGGIIVDTNNDIFFNVETNMFLTTGLNISLVKKVIRWGIGWNYNAIIVDIT
jgi:hypothetical protein